MPKPSSSTRVTRWPGPERVVPAVEAWAADLLASRSEVARVALVGSYARGDAGFGSDVDLVVVVSGTLPAGPERAVPYLETRRIPVPTDVLVFTEDEWRAMDPRFGTREAVEREGRWLAQRSTTRALDDHPSGR